MFAMLASCSQNVTAPISQESVSNITNYFWWNGETPMPFLDSITMTACKPFGTLSFANNASGLLEVSDGTLPQMQCIVNEDSIVALGFTLDSIMGQNNGSYFSTLDTEIFDTLPEHAIVITDNPRQIIVGTDSGVYFYTPGSVLYFQSGGLFTSVITTLAVNAQSSILYAGTAAGTIFSLHLPITKNTTAWSPYAVATPFPSGPIKQLLSLPGDSIAATVTGQIGIYVSQVSGYWSQVPYFQSAHVTALGLLRMSTDTFLLAGTSDGYLGAHSLDPTFTDPAPVSTSRTIYCLDASTSVAVAGTDYGVYQWSGPSNNIWTPVSNLSGPGKPVTSLGVGDNNTIITLSNGLVETATIGGPPPSTLPKTASAAQDVGWISTTPWVLTSRDFDTGTISVSGFATGAWPNDTGGLVLMRDNLFANDSSWRAGTIVTHDTTSFPITARVLGHLDTLYVEASGLKNSYPDVLEVRYSYEHPGEIPEFNSVPYWIMYYAKDQGPVMFDKESGTGLERHEIKP
jgi:hypothetical protein